MKVTSEPQLVGTKSAATGSAQEKPRTKFSDVLKEERQPLAIPVPVLAPAPPFYDVAAVDPGHPVSPSDALLSSLLQEIVVEAPPGSNASVDIQFNSRTLKGLHVRVQRMGDSVDVRFSTSSEAVSRLLTANAQSLADALVQRGYIAPAVSVHQIQSPATVPNRHSRQGARDGNSRRGQEQSGGQKRR